MEIACCDASTGYAAREEGAGRVFPAQYFAGEENVGKGFAIGESLVRKEFARWWQRGIWNFGRLQGEQSTCWVRALREGMISCLYLRLIFDVYTYPLR